MANEHPNIINHRRKIQKGEYTQRDLDEFNKWRNNPKKCPNGGELKAAADALIAEFEANGGLASMKVRTPRIAGVPAGGCEARCRKKGAERGAAPPTRDDTNNAGAAGAGCLGNAFHNPYTFISFPEPNWFSGVRERRLPTPLTMDEIETDRFTGTIDIELCTISPLLTCCPDPVDSEATHKVYRALAIGDDVILPATGVRGSLRNLMSILAGGTLGYLDEGVWLVQGRDKNLGPKGKSSPLETPEKCFLGEVIRPGTESRSGRIKLGETRLVKCEELPCSSRNLPRPQPGKKPEYLWVTDACESMSKQRDEKHCWKLKLSGRPIKLQGKREGLFKADGREIDLPPAMWMAYSGRHRHGDHPELRPGDLVWLEPSNPDQQSIDSSTDVASIQWARWGHQGEQLKQTIEKHHRHMLPDAMNGDGKVDEVSDLFGQVPLVPGAAGPFAARIRPENLVFRGAVRDGIIPKVVLAPLAPPHPGCSAFYRANTDADTVTNSGPLRGVKAYRVSGERGGEAPWHFRSQGVYDDQGGPKKGQEKVNKTCDLVKEGRIGHLRLACRSLSRRELALLLLCCSVDWRLGGGKPLGLGHCRPESVTVRDEFGQEVCRVERQGLQPADLPELYAAEIGDLLERRVMWHCVMQPVDKLRYPRAVDANRHRIHMGGHTWFQRHANPSKGGGANPVGLEVFWVDEPLRQKAGGSDRVAAQPLPHFDPKEPRADCLYGYDLFAGEGDEWVRIAKDNRSYHKRLESFDPQTHVTGREHSGGFQGQNQQNRRSGREDARRRHRGD